VILALLGLAETALGTRTVARSSISRSQIHARRSPIADFAKPVTKQVRIPNKVENVKKQVLKPAIQPKLNPKNIALGLLMIGAIIKGVPSAHALDIFDDDWVRNFKVDFAGYEIDHRVIVEGVVAGQFVGFIGALVGGRAARKRQAEVEKLAKQLKEVNLKLRERQSRVRHQSHPSREVKDPLLERIFGYLRMGKRTLKEKNASSALTAFNNAMEAIAEAKRNGAFKNFQAERKAHRGLGAAQLLLENYNEALKHMKKVVEISDANNDKNGLGDAYGVIADIYTELDEYEQAALYYDKYIEAINMDQDVSELNLEM